MWKCMIGRHPTRWAQNNVLSGKKVSRPLMSASHAVGSEPLPPKYIDLEQAMSPSHPVGLELVVLPLLHGCKSVSIPHSGLGTLEYRIEAIMANLKQSPSHTVGSELRVYPFNSIDKYSHHPTRWARNPVFQKLISGRPYVTIPHGGLGTSNDHIKQNKTYQSFCQGGPLFK